MKIRLILSFLLLSSIASYGQISTISGIAAANPPGIALAPLRYLASDELKGRGFDRPEINIAARYIAGQFKKLGVKAVSGADGYFQPFTLKMLSPSKTGQVSIGNMIFKAGEDALQQSALDVNLNAQLVYIGHSNMDDISKLDVKGKIVMLDLGKGDQASATQDFMQIPKLLELLTKQGAVAAIERLNGDAALWGEIKTYLMQTRPQDPSQTATMPAIIVNNTQALQSALTKDFTASCTINITGTIISNIALKNVIGYIKGTDPKLNDQYVLLTSHYDHLGVAKEPKMEEGKMDSIYNGARDNAIGTTAVIDAARYFAKHPPKRSVLFITYSAEEEGLIGSAWYALHPLVPLNKTVYNLNIDNASYNDTSLITLVGLGRTSVDSLISKAVQAYGLHLGDDPTGGGLFFESDNYPLASKGVPAPTYSLGMKTFDDEIKKRYHQLSDEVGNMDMGYALKFIQSYILAAKYIADDPKQPHWTKGDQLEKAGQSLYGSQ